MNNKVTVNEWTIARSDKEEVVILCDVCDKIVLEHVETVGVRDINGPARCECCLIENGQIEIS